MTILTVTIADNKFSRLVEFLKKEGAKFTVAVSEKEALIGEEVDAELGEMALKGMESKEVNKTAFMSKLKKHAGNH